MQIDATRVIAKNVLVIAYKTTKNQIPPKPDPWIGYIKATARQTMLSSTHGKHWS